MRRDPQSVSISIATSVGNHSHIAVGIAMKQAPSDLKAYYEVRNLL